MSIKVMTYVWQRSLEREEGLLVLLALADFADDDGFCWPSVPMIAKKARITVRGATGILSRLEKTGQVRRQVGRGRGIRSTYVVVTDQNPNTVPVIYERLKTRTQAQENPKLTTGKPEARRNALYEPSREPSVEPPKVAAASPQPFEVRTPAAEEKATAHEADVLWVAERSRKGIDRFTDPKARANLRLSAKRALRHGVWQDIKDAILVHAPNPDANPWYLDEWTRVAAGQRREVETLQRKMAERAKDDNELRRHYARGAPKHISQFLPTVVSDLGA